PEPAYRALFRWRLRALSGLRSEWALVRTPTEAEVAARWAGFARAESSSRDGALSRSLPGRGGSQMIGRSTEMVNGPEAHEHLAYTKSADWRWIRPRPAAHDRRPAQPHRPEAVEATPLLERRVASLSTALHGRSPFDAIIGQAPTFRAAVEAARKVAATETTV